MKRIILSSLLTLLMFFNTTLNSFIRPEITVANGAPASATFFEEKVSNDLNRFNQNKVIHDGLVTSSVMLAGTTRLFVNIYNNAFEMTNQFIYSSFDYPALESTAIIVQSLPIRIGNKVFIYFYQQYDATEYRHHLIEVDVTTSVMKSIEFNLPNNIIDPISSDVAELDFLDNKLHLMLARDIATYSAMTIDYTITPDQNFSTGTTSVVINSALTNVSANIVAVNAESVIGYCYRFGTTVYCKDKNNSNLYSLSIPGIEIQNVIVSNQNYLALKEVTDIGGITTDVINFYTFRKNSNSNGLEAHLLEVINLNYANGGDRNLNIVFAHINRNSNQFKFLSIATFYTYNYLNDQLITGGYQPASYEDVYYNSRGQKLMVSNEGASIRATSDFYQLTFVINLANHNILAYNYYEDDLLIFAYDTQQEHYAYYRYPILPTSGGSSLVNQFVVTEAELRASLSFSYGSSYTPALRIDQVIFYKNAVYMLDANISIGGLTPDTINNLNIIQLVPQGSGKRIDSFYYNFNGDEAISFIFSNTLNMWNTLDGRNELSIIASIQLGPLVDISLSLGVGEFAAATTGASTKTITFFSSETDTLSLFDDRGALREVKLNIDQLKLQDYVDLNLFALINLPPQILESYTRGAYSSLYTDFSRDFAYESIYIRLDEHGNHIFRDRYNNIYTLYSLEFLNLNNPGLISINNEFLDINANSFDLAVSANINSILINIRSFFNRVLVTNPTPFSLNNGQNAINVTLKSLDNTIKTITFNILKAPAVPSSPPIVLPGLDPNYVPPTSSAQSSSSVSSSVISSSISSSSSTSSSIIASSSPNNTITSSSSSISGDNNTNNDQENPLNIWIILGIPAILTLTLLGYAQLIKGRGKIKVEAEVKKDEVETPNSKNKDNL